ncbi:unnamed protein product [Gordionus sp. m RMFG-2023]|uniref:uncharacterized protein LOC135931587 n=1 Tax=Gordionus sp. m RMFG-2023 TaxID=3053472 RepID=UPI0030DFBDC8
MIFRWGYIGSILWPGWSITNNKEFIFSCIAFAIIAFSYEAIKSLKEYLFKYPLFFNRSKYVFKNNEYKLFICEHGSSIIPRGNKVRRRNSASNTDRHFSKSYSTREYSRPSYQDTVENLVNLNKIQNIYSDEPDILTYPLSDDNILCHCRNRIIFNIWDHILQSIIVTLQTLIGLTLMSISMSLNIWFFLSIIIGAGIGYMCFQLKEWKIINK